MEKKAVFKMQLNSIEETIDPTLLEAEVIVHGFEKSGNNQIITEEVCKENMNTLKNKRVVCKYIPCYENNGEDALSDHEAYEYYDRNGDKTVYTDTIAVGFIHDVYIKEYTNENNESKKALFAKIYIWNDEKYSDIANLLQEWLERNIKICMSVEYMYKNYKMEDGVEYILSPIIYTAHALLNSEERGNYDIVAPAYEESQLLSLNDKKLWNKAVAQLVKKEVNKLKVEDSKNGQVNLEEPKNSKNATQGVGEDENEVKDNKNLKSMNAFHKQLNELSHGDIRNKIYDCLRKTLTADEYYDIYISSYSVFNDYFIYEVYEGDKYVLYKVNYTVAEDNSVSVDISNKVKVVREEVFVEVAQMEAVKNSLKEKENTITSLNSTIEKLEGELGEYKTQETERALNSKIEEYKEKFNAVGLNEEFESEEVQGLIKTSLNSVEAELKLTKMLVNTIKVDEPKEIQVKELCSKSSELIKPKILSFDERYGI